MKKKQITALLMAALMTAGTVLTGCGDSASDEGKKDDTGKKTEDGADKEEGDGEVKVITYGGWEGPIMIREMAEKFSELHPDVKIVPVSEGWMGNEKLTELAATGEMPDIINLENINIPMQNGWIIDLKPYIEADPDIDQLPKNFLKYGEFNDQIIMLPGAVYVYGVMMNTDLVTSNSIELPEYTWTVDQYKDILKKCTKKGSTVGINEVRTLLKHLPAQMNDELGWGAFNETKKEYQLGSEYEYAVNTVKELMDAKVSLFEWMDTFGNQWDFEEGSSERLEIEEAKANYLMEVIGESSDWSGWKKGKAACWSDFAWATGFVNEEDYGGFNWDYYPVPVVEEGDTPRIPLVVDSMAITSTCKYPQEAYEFMKFLGYSSEGINARIDIVENQDMEALKEKYPDRPENEFTAPLTFGQMPATTDKAVIDRWAELNNVKPGLKWMVEHMDNGYVDGYKVTPGFDDAYHKVIEKVILAEVATGQKTFSDVAEELQTKANEITKEAYDSIG